jgi:hydrogenase maturation protease
LRIIGCGNRDRGDDAAGLLVASRLRAVKIDALDCAGDLLELLDLWTPASDVILVDAVITGQPEGTVTVFDATHTSLSRETFASSTHAIGVAEVVELARVLHLTPARLRIFGIESKQFEPGSQPSAPVLQAVEQVAAMIAQEIADCRPVD